MPTTSIHGTPDYAELDALGLDPSEVIYFSSNINPYGPPASVVEAVQNEISRSFLARYPDSRSQRLREKIGAYHGLPPDAVLVGNGTADLIWLLAHAYGNNRQAAILSPTFSEYADGVVMAGGHPNYLVLPGWQRVGRRRFAPGRHDAYANAAGVGVGGALVGLHLQSEQPDGRVPVTGRVALSVGRRARCPLGRR